MLNNIQELFTGLSKMNIIMIWVVSLFIILLMILTLYLFTMDFIGGLIIKPISWLYKRFSK